MSYSKAEIFNLALGALLLTKQVSDVDADQTTEIRTLRAHWKTALRKTLQDLDLDATSTRIAGSLVKDCPTPDWKFAYQYPTNCALFRRLLHMHPGSRHHLHKDVRSTQIPRQIANYQNQRVIFTNQFDAWIEYIPEDISLNLLNASAALALAYKLAQLSAPLIAGKGAGPLRKELQASYMLEKAQAMEHDRIENATFDADDVMSEFVQARTS